jgi:hypothetical protein
MLKIRNNFILQNVFGQVRFVNPFNPQFEYSLHETFELTHNNPVELSKRHWDGSVGNMGYVYFTDCEVTVRYCERRVSPRVWVNVEEPDSLEQIANQQHLQIGHFYKAKITFNTRFDVDEQFDHEGIVSYFENVIFNEPNIWNVFDPLGSIVSVIERDRETKIWKILSNAGLDRKDRKAYQHSMPIKSYRQFQYDMHRCGVSLFWKTGIGMNNPDINWEHRNDPKLSYILDIIGNGAFFVGRRDGVSMLKVGEKTLVVNHKKQHISFGEIPEFSQSEIFGKRVYMAFAQSVTDLGREINHIRNEMQDDLSVEHNKFIDETLLEIQRRLTI